MRKERSRAVVFYQRKWFLGLTALVGLGAAIFGIVNGIIPMFRATPVFENAEFVVDSSQAMATQSFDGMTKLQAAAQAVQNVMTNEGLQRNNLALREIGGDCGKPSLTPELRFSTSNEARIRNHMAALAPHGSSNLIDTLLQAITDFDDVARFKDVSKRIIVITGNPDACGKDVEAVRQAVARLKEQAKQDLSVDFHFIGLGLTEQGIAALHQLADTTGGSADFPQTRQDLNKLMHRIAEVEPVVRAGTAVNDILNANVDGLNHVIQAVNNGDLAAGKQFLQTAHDTFDKTAVPFRDLGKRQTTPEFKALYVTATRQRDLQRKLLDASDAMVRDPKKETDYNANRDAYNSTLPVLQEQLHRIAAGAER